LFFPEAFQSRRREGDEKIFAVDASSELFESGCQIVTIPIDDAVDIFPA